MNISAEMGFTQPIENIAYIDKAILPNAVKIDLIEMAKRSLNYLENNPVKEADHQCRFTIAPMYCPPFTPDPDKARGHIDQITIGDTENRNDIAFNMMRIMLGEKDFSEAQEKVHERLRTYIKDEGAFSDICWNYGYNSGVPECLANLWATSMLLQSELERFSINGDTESLKVARRLFEGIEKCAVRENGRAYFKAGNSFFDEDRYHLSYIGHYPTVLSPLCDYYICTQDPRCMGLLKEIAEGFLYDLTPKNLHREDGGVDGHNHVQMHATRGMAQLSYITGDVRYLKWTYDVYGYYRKWALDTGWLPEIRHLPEHSNHSETCLNGDMHETEIWLALCGYDDLWDRVDRGFRNYFAPCQFKVEKKFEKLFREINSGHTESDIQNSLKMLRELEGGFISALTPNDVMFEVDAGEQHFASLSYKGKVVSYDMMGCCPPEGMRALYYTWKYAVCLAADKSIHINLPYDIDNEFASIRSGLPLKGEIKVTANKGGTYCIRIPKWTRRDMVRAHRNGHQADIVWGGVGNMYITFDNVLPCDELTVDYPLIDMWQDIKITPYTKADQAYRYHWIGNSVVEVSPNGKYLPLYKDEIY